MGNQYKKCSQSKFFRACGAPKFMLKRLIILRILDHPRMPQQTPPTFRGFGPRSSVFFCIYISTYLYIQENFQGPVSSYIYIFWI